MCVCMYAFVCLCVNGTNQATSHLVCVCVVSACVSGHINGCVSGHINRCVSGHIN